MPKAAKAFNRIIPGSEVKSLSEEESSVDSFVPPKDVAKPVRARDLLSLGKNKKLAEWDSQVNYPNLKKIV